MEPTKLDILLVQNDPKELYKALDKIKSDRNNILFSNCISSLKIGNQFLNIQFDRALYANKLVLVRRNCKIDHADFKHVLDTKKIKYQEVVFDDKDFKYKNRKEIKNIYFARGKNAFIESISDSKKKGIDKCTYYPNVKGSLLLKYFLSNGNIEVLDKMDIKGLIDLRDKIILLTDQGEKRNIDINKAVKILSEEEIITDILEDTKNILTKDKVNQYIKSR